MLRPARSVRRKSSFWFWLLSGGGLLLGFAIIWVGVGYNSFASLLACYRNHGLFYEYFPRTYWKWLLFNPVEFAVFFGGVPALMTVWALAARRRLGERLESVTICRALVAASLVVMVLLNVAGKNASEVARLWIFFMPLLALPAAALTARNRGNRTLALAALLQGMNLVLFRVLVDVWRVEALFDELLKSS